VKTYAAKFNFAIRRYTARLPASENADIRRSGDRKVIGLD
jgi:hypothetical protein